MGEDGRLELTPDERLAALKELAALMEEVEYRRRYNQLVAYKPTAKQHEFHDLGVAKRHRLLMAGNQTGKTFSAGCEVAYHLTGLYPDWWRGRRWDRPTNWWAGGVTAESTRDNPQRILLGRKREYGTGTIPLDRLAGEPVLARSVPDAVDSFQVRHVNGGLSTLWFKNYAQGREKWQGETLDGVWYDEEPPSDIYTEGNTRLNRLRGSSLITFTPLLGMTDVVQMFFRPAADDPGVDQRGLVQMRLEDATFYAPEHMAEIEAGYDKGMRDARVRGLPFLGEGLVFALQDELFRINAFQLPAHFRRIVGLDFGIGHPTAVVWLAHDPDTDTVYLYDCYKIEDKVISAHVQAIRARGEWIPVAWPHDGAKRDPKSGEAMSASYEKAGVRMLPMSARYNDDRGGPQGREAIVQDILGRMKDGRFKVFYQLRDWFDEKATFHRKDGLIVPYKDDLMSATGYAMMMLRHARPKEQAHALPRQTVDYDPLSPQLPQARPEPDWRTIRRRDT